MAEQQGNKDVFVIGIGGTGMRCLQCFIHLCAMGMMDNTTVYMLALDTDASNGNFAQVKELVKTYRTLNGGDRSKSDTFFSARIIYNEYSPGYKHGDTFEKESDYTNARGRRLDDKTESATSDLVDLFLTPDERQMDLEDGYRARTQMGSMLMYHAIIKSAYNISRGNANEHELGLGEFLRHLNDAKESRTFIFGSVFGGTGASSIPILPRAFQEAVRILHGNDSNVLDSNRFYGATVLTSYFSFNAQKLSGNAGPVVATSDKFALNSQAALMFYNKDATIKRTYQRLYMLGRDEMKPLPDEVSTVTGGNAQRNPVDYIELLAAFAAYHFFKDCDRGHEAFNTGGNEAPFLFIAFDEEKSPHVLDFNTFVGNNEAHVNTFRQKLGIFTAAVLNGRRNAFWYQQGKEEFRLPENTIKALEDYGKMFLDYDEADKRAVSGWLAQLYMSALQSGYQALLLDKNIIETPATADFHDHLFMGADAGIFKFEKSGVFGDRAFNTIKKAYAATGENNRMATLDDFLSRTYQTFKNLYKL